MLKSKEELESYLKKEIYKFLGDRERPKKICEYSKDTYDIPRTVTSDYLSLRKPLIEASDFILFCLLDSIEQVNNQTDSKISYFFVDKEIKRYKSEKYHVDEIKFPIRFKVIEISEDQWIGRIDFKMLMKLRSAQLINYNENAQRTMTKIIRGDDKAYKITLYEKSVAAIANSYKDETYISTPITLTIPEESTADFYYDEEKCELVIKSIDHFDITDGYHRYVAACRVCDEDETFNYPMEIRISNWSESKAKHFVYQEDQKTKMSTVDSKSYNMGSDVNLVINKINTNPECNLRGLINNNGGIINFALIADLVEILYFKGLPKRTAVRSMALQVSKDIIESFNILTEYDTKYLEEEYSYKQLVVVMTCFEYYKNKDKKDMCETIEKVFGAVEAADKDLTKRVNKVRFIKEVKRIIEEVR